MGNATVLAQYDQELKNAYIYVSYYKIELQIHGPHSNAWLYIHHIYVS